MFIGVRDYRVRVREILPQAPGNGGQAEGGLLVRIVIREHVGPCPESSQRIAKLATTGSRIVRRCRKPLTACILQVPGRAVREMDQAEPT